VNILAKIKEWYDEVTWKKTTRKYCEKLRNAKMGLGDTVGQDDPKKTK
jgi:hypothetical protein|tara:strand:+ start:18107 stop:18250 length:144 start_codon:yes stop_codon:yes gene_type:complete